MKKILSLFAAVLFAGSIFAADATIAKGETNSYDDVTINGQFAVKMGKSSAGGDMTVTVGAGAKVLTLHAVAWNKEGGAKVFIAAPDGVGVNPAELELVANENIAGSGKEFSLEDEEAYKFEIALSGVEAETVLTLTSEKRAIVWGATYETEGGVDPQPEEGVVFDWAKEVGNLFLGASGVEISKVKIHENTDEVPAIKFGNSYKYEEGKYIAIKPAEGGFKAGDELNIAICFSNDDDSKEAQAAVYAADGETQLFLSEKAINARTSAADPVVESYILLADADSLLIGRKGNTGLFVISLAVKRGGDVPQDETRPTVAPPAPKEAEDDVMAIFCNSYEKNNANFVISGWAGAFELLDLEGAIAAYWAAMSWECIIDPAHTDDPHDFSNFKNIHIDMWAPAAAQIKLTAEAVAGGNYKDGQVVDLKKGWNSINIAVADWAGGYDFANLKCFVIEGYSLEGQPFAFTNLYFFGKKGEVLPDPTNCAEAAAAALSVSENNELYNDGKEYTIEGFVTGIKTEWSEKYKNISFWMADAADGGEVLQAFRAACETAEDAPAVGDKVKVTGQLTKYNDTPEFAAGCTFEILGEIEPLVKPEAAPAAPAQDEADVMAIFCNHYAENNANFWISGWAGGYEVLDLDGTNVAYWTGMTWECIIDQAHTDDPHDFSNYKTIHIDMWAPLPATIKFTAEAVAGGNYKDGVVLSLGQGWNNFDIEVANWPDGYDFSNLKCFVFENYQNQAGESFEGNPFAFANLYFFGKKSQGIENTTDGVKAVKVIRDGQVLILKGDKTFNLLGTEIK